MSSTRQVLPVDPGVSDVFSSSVWSSRKGAGLGLDVECTKAAVDLQNLTERTSESVIATALETLRRATGADLAFMALLDEPGEHFASTTCARGEAVVCDPSALKGVDLAQFPFLASRFEHLRLTEYRDTAQPGREDPGEAASLAALGFSSLLVVALHMQQRPKGLLAIGRVQGRGPWDVNYQLLLKLIGTSLATGLERLSMTAQLIELTERNALIDAASNEGLWDFNFDNNRLYVSPRWKTMMGYAHLGPDDIVDWRGMVHPDDLSRVQDAMFKHVSG
ncbi:MAG: PAS domain-containing protein, partial [Steroidobacteraceae bacterium]